MKEIIIEVTNTEVQDRSGVSKRTNQPYTIREQTAFVTLPNGEYRQIKLSLGDSAQPYAPGNYRLSYVDMAYVDRFSSLSFGRPVLIPLNADSKVA